MRPAKRCPMSVMRRMTAAEEVLRTSTYRIDKLSIRVRAMNCTTKDLWFYSTTSTIILKK